MNRSLPLLLAAVALALGLFLIMIDEDAESAGEDFLAQAEQLDDRFSDAMEDEDDPPEDEDDLSEEEDDPPQEGIARTNMQQLAAGDSRRTSMNTTSTPPYRSEAGWVADRAGNVSLERPSDWRLHGTSKDGRIRLAGTDGDELIVWPFVVRERLSTPGASVLLERLGSLTHPAARWGQVEKVGDRAIRYVATGKARLTIAGLSWNESGASLSAGFYYAISGPERSVRDNADVYSRIVASVRIRGNAHESPAASGSRMTPVSYRPWQEPNEQAFIIEVPKSWTVRGGLVRRAAVDVKPGVQITSPDGEVELFMGDASIPTFAVPSQTLTWTGFPEGSWYSPGYGVNMMVMRYMPGVEFARYFVQQKVPGQLANFQMTEARPLPDATRAINEIYRRHSLPGIHQEMVVGDVHFSGTSQGRRKLGYCLASTLYTGMADGGIWHVETLLGYVAPEARAGEAERILARVTGSLRLNPAWVRMQQGLTGNVSAIVSDTSTYISNVISSSHAAQQRSWDEVSRRYDNYILGTEDVRDPTTGREYKVESGSNYYWIDAGGRIVGTDLDANPDALRFEQMIRLP
jgi:hypothetical protein